MLYDSYKLYATRIKFKYDHYPCVVNFNEKW